jgi:hypothetical protein
MSPNGIEVWAERERLFTLRGCSTHSLTTLHHHHHHYQIFEFKWTVRHPVCYKCESIIKRQRDLLEKIKQLEDPPGSMMNITEEAQREKVQQHEQCTCVRVSIGV